MEIQKVIHFILNFISSNILTINTGLISLKVFNVNNEIPLEKTNERTLINTISCWSDDGWVTAKACSRMQPVVIIQLFYMLCNDDLI